MLKKLLSGNFIKDLGNLLQVFKDNKGRFSSKRTVAGAIIAIAASDFATRQELTWLQIVMAGIGAAIVIFAPMLEKDVKDEYPKD